MTHLRLICSLLLMASSLTANAQALDRYPHFGAFGGIGMPLDFSAAGRDVAQNLPSAPAGLMMSVPLAKPILKQNVELMLKLGLINTNVRYTSHAVDKPIADFESTLIGSLLLLQGNLFATVYRRGTFHKSLGQLECK